MSNLTQNRLKEVLHYDAGTGIFTRLVSAGNGKVGTVAGTLTPYGYIIIMVDGRLCFAHRLAFLYMTGSFPADQCDHINHIKDDNRWKNLREADQTMNLRNQSMRSDNTSGCVGVHWDKASSKWEAQIQINGESKYLGQFIEKSDAIEARKAADTKYGFHPNHGLMT